MEPVSVNEDVKLSPEAIREIIRRRHTGLLEKWFAGKASLPETREIGYILEQLPSASGSAAIPAAPGVTAPTSPAEDREQTAKIRRTGYQHMLCYYAESYDTDERTIKRWISKGRELTPPDQPPLDSPVTMPAWWCRVSKQRPPPGIAAAAARGNPASCKENPAPSLAEKIAAAVVLPAGPATSSAIDLSTIETPEGLALKQARVFVAATYQKLNAAYAAGNDDEIRLWQPRWEKATETLRKAESEDRNAQKHRGDLLPRLDVLADLSSFLQTLKVLRASMAKRIMARLPQLPPEHLAALKTAVEAEREREDDVLRNLQVLQTPEEAAVRFELERV